MGLFWHSPHNGTLGYPPAEGDEEKKDDTTPAEGEDKGDDTDPDAGKGE